MGLGMQWDVVKDASGWIDWSISDNCLNPRRYRDDYAVRSSWRTDIKSTGSDNYLLDIPTTKRLARPKAAGYDIRSSAAPGDAQPYNAYQNR